MNQIINQTQDQPSVHNQDSLLARFGTPDERVARAVDSIRQGGGVVVVDDEDRENEGDIIYPADGITVEQMALLIRACSGIVCLILTDERTKRLELAPMAASNSSRFGTAFTVSIEARDGVTTGVSAADRVTTIRTAIADDCRPEELSRPGHVFPIRAHPGGLAVRRGHSEATIELMRRAGRKPAGVLCEVMNPDGTMARLPELVAFALEHGMPVVSIEDLSAVRLRSVA
ncbi:3,4-dihydroxy-2-butanone-4-phosphate synthase [Azospirillum doebereinerae]|uniref:3,4-dihydroxy-2-butanone 4-phosphate synthase n=1 Tax=Azospirillum doebereinerae TaxID=92933 RepID=A0A433J772_9PROT|nr:3,4-dihydroxy-2-butanone-4-phosphate synthase [Azospirillum doebereinerae]MCG5240695.1 3,4-dihydroxy-2-butanone-4-phosphate synthase [Azospirillum doebereinerae]RUQ69279.1 3,4-dihydroxy-2-butanone-4-phosphate synthase [Azospirillum doebereinerae]